ncbi:hypothetical protein GmRootA79_02130 [Acidovorax sp. A79]
MGAGLPLPAGAALGVSRLLALRLAGPVAAGGKGVLFWDGIYAAMAVQPASAA